MFDADVLKHGEEIRLAIARILSVERPDAADILGVQRGSQEGRGGAVGAAELGDLLDAVARGELVQEASHLGARQRLERQPRDPLLHKFRGHLALPLLQDALASAPVRSASLSSQIAAVSSSVFPRRIPLETSPSQRGLVEALRALRFAQLAPP